jgi:hypothetical protein
MKADKVRSRLFPPGDKEFGNSNKEGNRKDLAGIR